MYKEFCAYEFHMVQLESVYTTLIHYCSWDTVLTNIKLNMINEIYVVLSVKKSLSVIVQMTIFRTLKQYVSKHMLTWYKF